MDSSTTNETNMDSSTTNETNMDSSTTGSQAHAEPDAECELGPVSTEAPASPSSGTSALTGDPMTEDKTVDKAFAPWAELYGGLKAYWPDIAGRILALFLSHL